MKQFLKHIFAKFGYRIQGTRYIAKQLLDPGLARPLTFDDIVCRRMFKSRPNLTFVQIGAFDGVMNDPLLKYIKRCNWRGIMVEPQSRAVARLRERYQDNDQIIILHAALSENTEQITLYTVDSNTAPEWAGGLASTQKAVVMKHSEQITALETMIREEVVDCVTFNDLLERLGSAPDILQIDTEGSDGRMISLFPFERVRPAIVHWEIKHLSKIEREACLARLSSFGYRFAPSGDQDMLAVNFG